MKNDLDANTRKKFKKTNKIKESREIINYLKVNRNS